jgi:mRNA interferase RelE/StbE
MPYQIDITPAAKRQLRKLPKSTQPLIAAAIEGLAIEPRPDGVVKLEGGKDKYRVRVHTYRIIYEISDRQLSVLVVKVGHRRDVYE